MPMSAAYVTVLANAGAAAITHWGLVNAAGTELSGGSYARIPSAGTNVSGTVRPAADCLFQVPAGTTVGGWRAFSALTGGTNYGGQDISPNEVYGQAGMFNLAAASTGSPTTAV